MRVVATNEYTYVIITYTCELVQSTHWNIVTEVIVKYMAICSHLKIILQSKYVVRSFEEF